MKNEANRPHAANSHSIPFVEYDLDNGMHIILSANKTTPLVVTNLWYHVGAKDDPPSRSGFAHLFEHMMFQGSNNVGKAQHFNYIYGAGGSLNATTNVDRTNYFELLPAEHLELALWLESDRMLSLQVTKENFENQRAVVKEERRQRYDNRPYGTVWEQIVQRLWPRGTYHNTTIGSMDDLDQATIEDVLAFHQEFYKPNNCSLMIAGDFNESEARRMIDRYFGPIPKGVPVNRPKYEIYPLEAPTRFQMQDNVKLEEVDIVFQCPPAFDRELDALELIALAFDNSHSSRMYRELVYEKKMAERVDVITAWFEVGSGLSFYARAQPGVELRAIEDAMWSEIERIRREPMSEQELTKLKNRAEMEIVERNRFLLSRADHLQRARCFTGDTELANRQSGIFQSITPEEITAAATKYLARERSLVGYVTSK